MKTSNVLASLLFGSLAVAAPLRQRDYVTKTELVVQTVIVYTTVWDGETPIPKATSTPGLFYEQPSKPASSKASPTPSTPAYTPPVVKEPSSVYTPPPSSQKAEPTSVYTPPPPPPSSTPAPEAPKPSSAYTPAPAPAPSSAAPSPPAPAPSSPPSSPPQGDKHSGDITIYDNTGAAGACGNPLTDGDMIVALAKGAWGASTYDVMTGASTNPWCGKTITVEYQGKKIQARIEDMCPGCTGTYDIDLSLAAWKALTGLEEKTRLKADWYLS